MKAYKGTASVPFSVDDVIRYPVAVQQKYDGIRCIVNDGIAQSASGKPLPCALLNYLVYALPYGYDGEIIHEDGYRFADSWCMSRDSTHDPKIHYVIYDRCVDRLPFSHRRPLFFTEQSAWVPAVALMVEVTVEGLGSDPDTKHGRVMADPPWGRPTSGGIWGRWGPETESCSQ